MKRLKNHLRTLLITTSLLTTSAFAASVDLTVNADQPGPVINKNIYGQFAEHLGHGIYEVSGSVKNPESLIQMVFGKMWLPHSRISRFR